MTDLAAAVALSLGYTKQWGMPLWYKDGNLIRTGVAWGALPSLEALRNEILREVERRGAGAEFLESLELLLDINVFDGPDGFDGITIASEMALLRATPEQIAQAWLAITTEDAAP